MAVAVDSGSVHTLAEAVLHQYIGIKNYLYSIGGMVRTITVQQLNFYRRDLYALYEHTTLCDAMITRRGLKSLRQQRVEAYILKHWLYCINILGSIYLPVLNRRNGTSNICSTTELLSPRFI
jgi:hypothetical protein